jgi:hypothetical protein
MEDSLAEEGDLVVDVDMCAGTCLIQQKIFGLNPLLTGGAKTEGLYRHQYLSTFLGVSKVTTLYSVLIGI